MTLDETIIELQSVGVVIQVGNEYHITEKYKTLLKQEPKRVVIPVSANKKILEKEEITDKRAYYPKEVVEQKGRLRASAFMNFCEIPTYSESKTSKYRLRSFDSDSIKFVNHIVENPEEYDPKSVVEVIKNYYDSIDMPKSFKNFISNDFPMMYVEYLQTGALLDNNNKDNQKWS